MKAPAWLLLALCAFAASPRLWTGAGALLWLAPAVFPIDLLRPRGFGAWALWALWTGVCAFLSARPFSAAEACARYASGVLLFALCYSWWGRPHRRAWLAALWVCAAAWGGYALMTGQVGTVALGLTAAALGSSAAASGIGEGGWRWGALGALAATLVLAALFLTRSQDGGAAPRTVPWRAGWAVLSDRPLVGSGPGLFKDCARRAGFSPPDRRGPARSLWVAAGAETGTVGLGLLLIAIAFSLSGRSSREWERRAAKAAFVALATFAAFEDVLAEPALLAVWFTALAAAAPGFEEQEARPFRLSLPAAALGAAASLFLALRGGLGEDLSPGAQALAALAASPAELGRALDRADRAAGESPRDPSYPRLKSEIYRRVGAGPEADYWVRVADHEP